MIFKPHTIPLKIPDVTCNARMWTEGGTEGYCSETTNKERCLHHNPGRARMMAQEEMDAANLVNQETLGQRAALILADRRKLTSLDEQVANSLATIQELEHRYPISSITTKEAINLERLRLDHADLVHQRTDLEIKLKRALNAEWIWENVQDLFEKTIVDTNTRQAALEGMGRLLDSLIEGKDIKV